MMNDITWPIDLAHIHKGQRPFLGASLMFMNSES